MSRLNDKFNNTKFLIVCFAIIFLGISYQIFPAPYIGIANSGDFQRLSEKIGVDYSSDPWKAPEADGSFFKYEVNNFTYINPVPHTGFLSSYEAVGWFSRLIALFFSKTGSYDIRFMGAAALLLYMAACGLLFYAIRNCSKGCVLVTGISFVLISVDPYLVQYFNSFYSELGMIIPLITFFAAALLYWQTRRKMWMAMEFVFAVFTATAKPQNILLIFTLFALIFVQLITADKRTQKEKKKKVLALAAALLCSGALITQMDIMANQGTEVAQYNVIVKDLLLLSKHPEDRLAEIGFTQEETKQLSPYIGQTAFTNPYYNAHPQMKGKFTRINEFKIILREPGIFPKFFSMKAKDLFQDMSYGNFIKGQGPASLKCTAFPLNTFFKKVLLYPNLWFYLIVIVGSIMLGILKIRRGSTSFAFPVLICMSLSNLLQFAVSSLGDGNENAKHFFAVNIEFEAIYIILLFQLILFFTPLFKKIDSKR